MAVMVPEELILWLPVESHLKPGSVSMALPADKEWPRAVFVNPGRRRTEWMSVTFRAVSGLARMSRPPTNIEDSDRLYQAGALDLSILDRSL